jgi:hypothetical protein
MRHARRLVAILIGCATWCMVETMVAHATMLHDPVPAGPTVVTSSGAGGAALWKFVALVALGVLLAGAVAGLGYSLSHPRRSGRARRSQQPLTR